MSTRGTIADIQRGERSGVLSFLFATVAVPLSIFFRLVVALRDCAYTAGLLRAKSLPAPVISVGNLTTGGTGKTPVVIMLARKLQRDGLKIAILTRGYRSQSENNCRVFDSQSGVTVDATEGGDETALMAAQLPGVWFGVGRNRQRTALAIAARTPVDVFILDDGFQHRRVARDLDIVVVDALNPCGNGRLFPAGSLREPVRNLRRADIVLLTRTECQNAERLNSLRSRIEKYTSPDRLFQCRTVLKGWRDAATGERHSPESFRGRKVLAFCGVGNPESFRKLLISEGIALDRFIVFPDHHYYDSSEVERLRQRAAEQGSDCCVTTEKDAAKFTRFKPPAGEFFAAEISFELEEGRDIFWRIIAEVCEC